MKQRGRRWWAASPGQAGKQAMIEALDFAAHKLIVSTGATKLSSDFAFLGRLDATRPPKQTRRPRCSTTAPSISARFARRPRRAGLADHRMAAEICPRTLRHRAILARSEGSLPRASDLHRYRSSRPRYPSGYCRHEPGAPIPPVHQPANRCIEPLGGLPPIKRPATRADVAPPPLLTSKTRFRKRTSFSKFLRPRGC